MQEAMASAVLIGVPESQFVAKRIFLQEAKRVTNADVVIGAWDQARAVEVGAKHYKKIGAGIGFRGGSNGVLSVQDARAAKEASRKKEEASEKCAIHDGVFECRAQSGALLAAFGREGFSLCFLYGALSRVGIWGLLKRRFAGKRYAAGTGGLTDDFMWRQSQLESIAGPPARCLLRNQITFRCSLVPRPRKRRAFAHVPDAVHKRRLVRLRGLAHRPLCRALYG
jgi:hypothetical protein